MTVTQFTVTEHRLVLMSLHLWLLVQVPHTPRTHTHVRYTKNVRVQ